MIWRLALVLGCCLAWGCAPGPSIEGKWTVQPNEALPIPATVTATFTKPNKMVVIIDAKPNIPFAKDIKVEADVNGTWKMEGQQIEVHAAEVMVRSTSNSTPLPTFVTDPIEKQVRDAIDQSASGTFKWKDADTLVITREDGKGATLTRIKG